MRSSCRMASDCGASGAPAPACWLAALPCDASAATPLLYLLELSERRLAWRLGEASSPPPSPSPASWSRTPGTGAPAATATPSAAAGVATTSWRSFASGAAAVSAAPGACFGAAFLKGGLHARHQGQLKCMASKSTPLPFHPCAALQHGISGLALPPSTSYLDTSMPTCRPAHAASPGKLRLRQVLRLARQPHPCRVAWRQQVRQHHLARQAARPKLDI